MGALECPLLWPPPPPPPLPTSPPSKTPPLPPPPPPPRHPPHFPLPPPPPFPPGFPPPSISSFPPPLPYPCSIRMPPRHGLPPPGAGASASVGPARAFPYPGGTQAAKEGHFVEHLVSGRGVPVTRGESDVAGQDDLAGVPPDLLPPKKRIVRYEPYEAALAIQEMASHGGGGEGAFLLGAAEPEPPMPTGTGCRRRDVEVAEERNDDGLREELLRLRISRPTVLLTKQLTWSDRSRDRGRLVLPGRLLGTPRLRKVLTEAEWRLVHGAGLPVPALDRLGRTYRMSLRRDHKARTYRVAGQWSLFVSRHGLREGDSVEMLAFRPPAWQARLDSRGEGGLGMALLHHSHSHREAGNGSGHGQGYHWCNRERDAADGLLLMVAAASARPATVAGA